MQCVQILLAVFFPYQVTQVFLGIQKRLGVPRNLGTLVLAECRRDRRAVVQQPSLNLPLWYQHNSGLCLRWCDCPRKLGPKLSLVVHVKVMDHYDPGTPLSYKISGPSATLAPQLPATIAYEPTESDGVRFQKGQCHLAENSNVAVVLGNNPHLHGRSPRPPSRQYSPRLPSCSRYSRRAEYSLDVIVFRM